MTATPEQKKELILEALVIAGFTENTEYPGIFTQEHGMKRIVKDLNIGCKSYFLVDKKKVIEDDEHKTLENVDKMITEAVDGRMPSRTDADIVVIVGTKDISADDIGAPKHNKQQIITSYVKNNVWGPDDEYLTVTVQVDSLKFKRGDLVKVTVDKI